jgi:hypothetical protein
MLDGSNLGRFGFAQSENGWPIFYRVSDLFADPATQIRINPDDSESMNLSWSRPTEALNMMKNLSIDTTRLEREMEGMLRQVVEGSAQIDSANARIAEIENHLESLSEESEAVS